MNQIDSLLKFTLAPITYKYGIANLSKHIQNKKDMFLQWFVGFTDAVRPSVRPKGRVLKKNNLKINYFFKGASFIILNLKEPKNKTNWTVKTRFTIGLHKKDTLILELIKSYFGGIGTISPQNKESVQYRVGSLKDLNDKIIPRGLKK